MDPVIRLFHLNQGDRPIEEYVEEFCGLCYGVDVDDDVPLLWELLIIWIRIIK